MVALDFVHSPLDAGQNGRHIVRRAPSVLQNIQAQLPGAVDVGVEHLADELDAGRLGGILLLKMHDQSKGTIFERSIGGPDDDGVP